MTINRGTLKFSFDGEPGCYLAGHRGQYIFGDVVRFAIDYGFEIDAAERTELDASDWEGSELAIDLAEVAIEWLNDHVAKDGNTFGWQDGEFFYQSIEWWSEA